MSRILSLIAVAAAAMSLGGCVHQKAEGFSWSFQQNPDEGVKLAYGQPQSDNVLLMMTCAPGSGQVMLSAIGGRDDIVLAAGKDRDRFDGRAAPSAFGTGHLVEAQAHTAAPSLRTFARTGELAMMEGRRRIDLAAEPQERAGVQRFFRTCRA